MVKLVHPWACLDSLLRTPTSRRLASQQSWCLSLDASRLKDFLHYAPINWTPVNSEDLRQTGNEASPDISWAVLALVPQRWHLPTKKNAYFLLQRAAKGATQICVEEKLCYQGEKKGKALRKKSVNVSPFHPTHPPAEVRGRREKKSREYKLIN